MFRGEWIIILYQVDPDTVCSVVDEFIMLFQVHPDTVFSVVNECIMLFQVDPDTVCSVVDCYLLELAERDKLDVDTFNKLAGAVPREHRQSHDTLFKVLEKLLKSGTTHL